MEKFRELVHNFPKYAGMISSTKLQRAGGVKADVERWHASGIGQALPMNAVFVNGRRFDLAGSTFNVYDLLEQWRSELNLQSKLASVYTGGVTPLQSKQVLRKVAQVANDLAAGTAVKMSPIEAQMGGPIIRIDVSKGGKYVVHFLNNLEKDEQYRAWPRSLKALTQPSWSLHTIARNMFTLIAVVDPVSVDGAHMLLQLQMILQQMYPIRLGVVVACADDTQEDTAQESLCSKFSRLFANVLAKHGMESASNFAFSAAEKLHENAMTAMQYVSNDEEAALVSRQVLIKDEILLNLFAIASAESENAKRMKPFLVEGAELLANPLQHRDFVINSTLYVSARGLTVNGFSLNGVVAPQGQELGGAVMQMLGREQYLLGHLVKTKVVNPFWIVSSFFVLS